MKRVQIAELKADLSRHLRAVGQGEDLVVLNRQVPVARIIPYRAEEAPGLTVVPSTEPSAGLAGLVFPPLAQATDVVATLLADRQSR